jgi:chemotaxis protein MotB
MTRPILEDEEPPLRVPGWAFTYIDLMWLLLIFFILRSVLGDVGDSRRYRDIAAALKKRFGVEARPSSCGMQDKKARADSIAKDRKEYGEIVRDGFDDKADSKKRLLACQGVIYFPDEAAQLQSEQRQLLQAVAERIGHDACEVEIRGDAADSSYARCIAARDFLVKLGIEPKRLRIALGGERSPESERPQVRLYSVTEIVAERSGKVR